MKAVLFALLALPVSLLAEGGLPNQPYIYVEGKAKSEQPADVVTLRFDLVARNPEQLKANREVQSKAIRILASLNERKIPEKDVIASDIRSEPEYENEGRRSGKVIGFIVRRSFAVQLRDLSMLPKLIDELLAMPGAELSGVTGELSGEKEMRDDLWKKALTNAREDAEKTLKEMGMKIDSVFAVSPVPFPEIEEKVFGTLAHERIYVTGSYIPTDTPQYKLAPIVLSQSVHVIYLISPGAPGAN